MNEYKMYYNVSITADAAKVHTGRPRLVRELCPNKHSTTVLSVVKAAALMNMLVKKEPRLLRRIIKN